MHEETFQLTTAIASGDTEAFGRFYERWFDEAFGCAKAVSRRDEQFCLDVVQDAMLRVIKHIKPLNSEESVRRWLRTVVQSCCLDRLRSEGRRARRERRRAMPLTDAGTDDPAADRMDWLRRQFAALPPEDARLLELRFRLNWTLKRISRLVGISVGAVDGRIQRTLAAMRTRVKGTSP